MKFKSNTETTFLTHLDLLSNCELITVFLRGDKFKIHLYQVFQRGQDTSLSMV